MWLLLPLLLTPRIEYRADLEGCPSAEAFTGSVVSRLPDAERSRDRTFSVVLSADGATVREGDASRTIPRATDCAELAEAAALAIAIAIDPLAARQARTRIAVLAPQTFGVDASSAESWTEMVRDELATIGYEVVRVESGPCFGRSCTEALADRADEVVVVRLSRGIVRYDVDTRLYRTADGEELDRFVEQRWSWSGLRRHAPLVAGSLSRRVDGRLPKVTIGFRYTVLQRVSGYERGLNGYEVPVTMEWSRWSVEVAGGHDHDVRGPGHTWTLDRDHLSVSVLHHFQPGQSTTWFAGGGLGTTVWRFDPDWDGVSDRFTRSSGTAQASVGVLFRRRKGVQLGLHASAHSTLAAVEGRWPAAAGVGASVRFGFGRHWDVPVVDRVVPR